METDTSNSNVVNVVSRSSLVDGIIKWSLLAVTFLTPLFFIPSSVVLFPFSKVVILFVGVAIAFCAFLFARLKDGVIGYTFHYFFLGLAAIPFVYALSSFFSTSRMVSIIGAGFEVSSLLFIVTLSVFSFFIAFFFSTKQKMLYAYLTFLIPIPLVALFHAVRLIAGPEVLSFGVFTTKTATLLGGWNDLGIYFGAVALFSFISLELLKLDRFVKITCIVLLAISLFFLTIIHFSIIWYILAVFALIFFVYNFSFNKSRAFDQSPVQSDGQRNMPIVSLIVVIISVIFILFKGNIYTTLASWNVPFVGKFAVENVEVAPSWGSTYEVAREAFIRNPILGSGPNRFLNEWLLSKPDGVNRTAFWGTDFNYGIGLIPTFLTTTGAIGVLAWLIFFVLFIYMGFKVLFTRNEDSFLGYVTISSFAIALYFWIFAFIYVPSSSLLVLTFFFTGIFMASLVHGGFVYKRSFNFIRDPRTSFVSVLIFIVLLLVVFVSLYGVGKKFVASIYFNQALAAANFEGNIAKSEAKLLSAVRMSGEDQYYRTLADLNLIKINQLLSQQGISADVLQAQFRSHLASAQSAAQTAVDLDQSDYQNWLTLGKVYESVVPLKVEGAYESAQAAYSEARKLNPKSPAIPLVIARLDVAHSDIVKAKQEIDAALALKPDYTDAFYFLSQIQAQEGDVKSAIASTEAAAYLNPSNAGVYFQLGLLRYNNEDYAGAAAALEQALALTPNYANAQYFLGLSYAELKKIPEAIVLFETLQTTNPDNSEVAKILENLRTGKAALAGVLTPPVTTPQSRSRPPVPETPKKADTADR